MQPQTHYAQSGGVNNEKGFLLLAILTTQLMACGNPFTAGHRNFKDHMQLQVGRSTEHPYAYTKQYRDSHVSTRILANGNVEEEYKVGRGWKCRVFFEIDKKTSTIVSWRYEGDEDVCVIPL
jgi:hypothetical protein